VGQCSLHALPSYPLQVQKELVPRATSLRAVLCKVAHNLHDTPSKPASGLVPLPAAVVEGPTAVAPVAKKGRKGKHDSGAAAGSGVAAAAGGSRQQQAAAGTKSFFGILEVRELVFILSGYLQTTCDGPPRGRHWAD
jgi:hypothetical protein